MVRLNYAKMITDNAIEGLCTVIPVEEGIERKMIAWCRKNDTPSGNDRIRHFFVNIGLYGFHLDFIRTEYSGSFLKIKKHFTGI